jgi:hypothetical protein
MSDFADPLSLQYDGWDAEEHRVDAQRLGLSLQGVARIYRITYHFYLTGQLPTRLTNPDVRILVGPPTPGSLSYAVWVLMEHGRLVAYPQLLADFADLCVPEFIKAMLAKRGGRSKDMSDAIDKIYDLAKENIEINKRLVDFAREVHQGQLEARREDRIDKERLLGVVERLSQRTSSAMIDMVAPVGHSTRMLTNSKGQEAEFVVDEPTADVIRAKGDLEVLDEVRMKVKLGAVDTIARTCKITAPEFDRPIKAKITDPALMLPRNVYTHALDHAETVIITGKPAHKDGELYLFYISDAKPAS